MGLEEMFQRSVTTQLLQTELATAELDATIEFIIAPLKGYDAGTVDYLLDRIREMIQKGEQTTIKMVDVGELVARACTVHLLRRGV